MLAVSSAEMRELDRLTIEKFGTPGHVLMERAGAGATEVFWASFPNARRHPIVVAGKGNNGGDGFVVARLLRKRGVRCDVVLLAHADDLRGDAARNLRAFRRVRGRVIEAPGASGVAKVAEALKGRRVVIDAIFGTGLNAPVSGPMESVLSLINSSGLPVFAIDIPSGLDADSGQPLGTALEAGATATFGFPKIGQLTFPGASFVGDLTVVDIGIAAGAIEEVAPQTHLLTRESVGCLLPARIRDLHKGGAGHVLIVAGGRGKTGAAVLAAEASMRSGAGLTTLVVPDSERSAIAPRLREVMSATLPADADGSFRAPSPAALTALIDGKTSVVVGPGIGTSAGARALVQGLVRACPQPLVIDADGLNCLAGSLPSLRRRKAGTVLTPHPGEMSRLVGDSIPSVQSDRLGTARRLARQTGATVTLKGARTIVASPSGAAFINPTGNPGMASGGMGDVLAGVVGALCAQGLEAEEAARFGVYLHGLAADQGAEALGGEIGLIASDVIAALPRSIGIVQGAASEPPSTSSIAKPAAHRSRGRAVPRDRRR